MSDSPAQPTPPAVEQLPVPLFDGVVLAARTADGTIYLALRDLCATLGLGLRAQQVRIRANESLRMAQLRIHDGRQFRTLDFLLLDDVPLWIMDIQSRRVDEAVRERFLYIKSYLVGAVKAAFAQLVGLPEGPSRAIEDLRDLDQIDAALRSLEQLGARQASIEQSQDRARVAFRDLQALVRELMTRVQTLEQQARQQITPAQRGALYQLVQSWGVAVAEQRPEQRRGEAIRWCWRMFNQRFGLSTYSDLPAARYDEAVQFVKAHYRSLTGREIDAAEQRGMELE